MHELTLPDGMHIDLHDRGNKSSGSISLLDQAVQIIGGGRGLGIREGSNIIFLGGHHTIGGIQSKIQLGNEGDSLYLGADIWAQKSSIFGAKSIQADTLDVETLKGDRTILISNMDEDDVQKKGLFVGIDLTGYTTTDERFYHFITENLLYDQNGANPLVITGTGAESAESPLQENYDHKIRSLKIPYSELTASALPAATSGIINLFWLKNLTPRNCGKIASFECNSSIIELHWIGSDVPYLDPEDEYVDPGYFSRTLDWNLVMVHKEDVTVEGVTTNVVKFSQTFKIDPSQWHLIGIGVDYFGKAAVVVDNQAVTSTASFVNLAINGVLKIGSTSFSMLIAELAIGNNSLTTSNFYKMFYKRLCWGTISDTDRDIVIAAKNNLFLQAGGEVIVS